MVGNHETAGAPSSSGAYTTVVEAHELRRQRSVPAAAFAPRGAGGGPSPRNLRNGGGDGHGEFRSQSAPAGHGSAPTGGVGAVARALWAWVVRARRRVLSGSGSSAKEQYGHEEYAQNFDDGAAAAEPENLSRSFSARYARQRRLAGAGAAGPGSLRSSRWSV